MINITEKGLNGTFSLELSRAQLSYVRTLAETRLSNQVTEKYAGVGSTPKLQEFKGEHHFDELGEDVLTVVNKTYVGGIIIPKGTLRDDKTGDIRQRMSELATSVQDHRDERIFDVIYNGATTKYKCYDGKKLFATDHKTRDSGTQSNDITYTDAATGNAPTPLEFGEAVLKTIRAIMALKDDRGRKMNKGARSFRVICPLNMMEAALAAINSEVIQGTAGTLDNVLKKQKRFSIMVEPEPDWDDDDTIVVARTDGPKPILLQELADIETFLHGPGSETYNKKKVAEYGVEITTGAAPWRWQSIARCTLS